MRFDLDRTLAVALPTALVLAGLLLGVLVQRLLLRRGTAEAGSARVLIVGTLRGPVVLWGAILGLYLALEFVALPARTARLLQQTALLLIIFSATWSLARLAAASVTYASRGATRLPSATLLVNVARLLVLAIGLLVILGTLGVSITPLLTALGVGGLAVGLALQDTLVNFFAGIHILTSRQVRPGDYVKLESGEEGYVVDITWRYTTIRQLSNNVTIVPNAKLASAIFTNYSLPETELAVLVQVGVSYGSDLARVEEVTTAVAREVLRDVPGAVPTFEPFIRYHTFGESSVNFTVILRGREFVARHLIIHEFIKRLHARYRREDITIPFPIRTLDLAPDAVRSLRDVARAAGGPAE